MPFGFYDIKTLATSPSADMIVPMENIKENPEIRHFASGKLPSKPIFSKKVYPFPYFCLVFELF